MALLRTSTSGRGHSVLALLLLASASTVACTGPTTDTEEEEHEEVEAAGGARAALCGSEVWQERTGPLTLGLIDGRIQCIDVFGGGRLCAGDDDEEDHLWIRHRYGITASMSKNGAFALEAVYTDAPKLCRGICHVYDSHYEIDSGDPFCDGQANLLEDGSPVTLTVLHASLPAPLAARWSMDWNYSRAVIGDAPEHESFEWPAEDAEEDDEDELGLPIDVLDPTVDLKSFFTGLVLRLDADEHLALPGTETVALAIADSGNSQEMAARLREMILDPELDPYNRIRAGAVLIELLQLDPALSGELGRSPLVGYHDFGPPEPSLEVGAMLLDEPEDAWVDVVVPYASDDGEPDDIFQSAVRASLASIQRPPGYAAARGPIVSQKGLRRSPGAAHLFR
jgi:hypothetical protein